MAWKKVEAKELELSFSFTKGTANLRKEAELPLQDRVKNAFTVALSTGPKGPHVYVCGPSGLKKAELTIKEIEKKAKKDNPPQDLCYVTNFKDPYRPIALILPRGKGKVFSQLVEDALEFLKNQVYKAFEGKELESQIAKLNIEINQKKNELINSLVEEAKKYNLMVLFSPEGVKILPHFKIATPVPEEKLLEDPKIKSEYEKHLRDFDPIFREFMRKLKELDHELSNRILELKKRLAKKLVDQAFLKAEEKFKNFSKVLSFLKNVKEELVKNIQIFIDWEKHKENAAVQTGINRALNLFRVNVVVDNSETQGAPVIYEKVPTLKGLFGQINYRAEMGILFADHMSITAGSLHRANGGYLIIYMQELLKNPALWVLLKRALKHGKLFVMGGTVEEIPLPHVGILPEPVDFSAKVFLLGDNFLYHLLITYDPEFEELFRIKAEFDPVVKIDKKVLASFPYMVKKIVNEKGIKDLDASGLSEAFKYMVELARNRKKVSLLFRELEDLLEEANLYTESTYIDERAIKKAAQQKKFRLNLIEEKVKELFKEKKILFKVTGKEVGQINGLSVYFMGDYAFGRPTRITAQVFPGSKGVINIEREVDLSGPIHSKGVLILSSYLYHRYGKDFPVQLSCTLTFEQSYEPVEGDSASAAELAVILSAISKIPLKQGIAITGSIDQFGNLQPVGGVKEKVEGFFDVCKMVRFTGKQGVIIPSRNLDELLLKEEVLSEIKAGKFHIYTAEHIDDVIEILTGLPAEKVHNKVQRVLKKFYESEKKGLKKRKS